MDIVVMNDIKQIINDDLKLLFRYDDGVIKEIFYYTHDYGWDLETKEIAELVKYVLRKLEKLETLYDLRER